MASNKEKDWTKKCILNKLSEINDLKWLNHEECAVETVDGEGGSVVVLMNSVGKLPISIMMNGQEVMADIVLISMDREVQS